MDNREKIHKIVEDILNESHVAMKRKISKAITSGAIDINSWDENNNPMILPKIIAIAILENEANQYKGIGTIFEKDVKKKSNNLKLFL